MNPSGWRLVGSRSRASHRWSPISRFRGPSAIFDFEESRCEVIILDRGEPVFARTLLRGTAGLPASAAHLSREFRQSLAAWRLVGELPKVAYLVGAGATAPGALEFFQGELGIPVLPLPPSCASKRPPRRCSPK